MRSVAWLAILSGAAACTGDDPGGGTGTLRVEASLRGAQNGDTAYTVMTVHVSKDARPVTEARVTVTSVSGQHVLGSDVRFPGRWSVVAERYDEVYVLEIEAGADRIEKVRVDGPVIAELVSPAPNTTIDPTAPLELRWEPSPADSTAIVINPQGTSLGEVGETGSFTVPANTLVSNAAGSHAIGLLRTNTVEPAGAVAGSTMSVGSDAYFHICDRPSTGLCSP